MEPKRLPALNRNLGYIRTPVGTVRVEPEGVALYATEHQLYRYAELTGVVVDADAALVELDNAGRLLLALPSGEDQMPALSQWVDALLEHAREHEAEETFFRGYTAGLKVSGAQPQTTLAPRPQSQAARRPPAPGSLREQVRRILGASAGEWLTAAEVAERGPEVLGESLNPRSVYNALVKEVKRGGVRRREAGGVVRYRLE